MALSNPAIETLRSLGVTHVYLMGGEAALTDAVAQALTSMGIEAIRVSGPDRYATANAALATARAAGSKSRTLIVVSGVSFPDALSVGPWAWRTSSPVLLVGADGLLPQSSVDAVRSDTIGFDRVIIVGGTAVVSDAVKEQMGEGLTYVRLAGGDRYATSVAVAEWATSEGLGWASPAVASGISFTDALSAAAAFGSKGSPVLLASDKACDLLSRKASSISSVTVVGGPAAVSDADLAAIERALGGGSSSSSSSSSSSNSSTPYYRDSWYVRPDGGTRWPTDGSGQDVSPSDSSDEDDAYVPTAAAEEDDLLELWADEEDVLVSAQSGGDWANATSKEQDLEELDARTSQTFYAQGPSGLSTPPQLVRVDDQAPLGAMARMSDEEVRQLDREYSGGDGEDVLDHALTYWKLTVADMPHDERTVTYRAASGNLTSDDIDVDYWLPFTTTEVDRMGQVDREIANLVDDDGFWALTADERIAAAERLLESLAARDLIEDGSWEYDDEGGAWTFLYNHDTDETDDDGILGMIECVPHEDEADDQDFELLGDQYEMAADPVEDGAVLNGQALEAPIGVQATKKGSALIINLFIASEKGKPRWAGEQKYYRQLKGWLIGQGLDTKLFETNITVGTFTTLNKYDVVFIDGHGGRYTYWVKRGKDGKYRDAWGIQVPSKNTKTTSRLYEVSGISIVQARNDKYYAPWLKDRQIIATAKGYWVLPKFIRVHYKDGALKNTFILSDTCSSFGSKNRLDSALGSAFVGRGATAFSGFLNTVNANYAKNYHLEVIENLLAGKTMGLSMGSASAKWGNRQSVWYAKKYPGKPYWKSAKGQYEHECHPRYVGNKQGRLAYFTKR